MNGKVLRLKDYLREDMILMNLRVRDKKALFRKVAEYLRARGIIKHPAKIVKVLLSREKLGSTSIGGGVALPHARSKELDRTVVVVVHLQEPVKFSPGEEPVKVAIFIFNSADINSSYIQILARLARLLRNPQNRKALLESGDASGVLKVFEDFDRNAEEIERKLRG